MGAACPAGSRHVVVYCCRSSGGGSAPPLSTRPSPGSLSLACSSHFPPPPAPPPPPPGPPASGLPCPPVARGEPEWAAVPTPVGLVTLPPIAVSSSARNGRSSFSLSGKNERKYLSWLTHFRLKAQANSQNIPRKSSCGEDRLCIVTVSSELPLRCSATVRAEVSSLQAHWHHQSDCPHRQPAHHYRHPRSCCPCPCHRRLLRWVLPCAWDAGAGRWGAACTP